MIAPYSSDERGVPAARQAIHRARRAAGAALSPVMARSEVVARYAAATGLDVSGIAFYHAFGLFRVAVIVQQIYIRYRRGQTSDPRFAMLDEVVPLLARDALEAEAGA